jgi:hypothetical protein
MQSTLFLTKILKKDRKIFNARQLLASVATPQQGMFPVDAFTASYCTRRNHTSYNCFCFHLAMVSFRAISESVKSILIKLLVKSVDLLLL